jgi:hypothetical protein
LQTINFSDLLDAVSMVIQDTIPALTFLEIAVFVFHCFGTSQ